MQQLSHINPRVPTSSLYHGSKSYVAARIVRAFRNPLPAVRPLNPAADPPTLSSIVRVGGRDCSCSKETGVTEIRTRAAFALGYERIGTYTLPEEGGASLRAAGWKLLGKRGGGTWDRRLRPRVDTHPTQKKFFWEVDAA